MSSNNASHGNRGWFEGTMEVISGMAPRPSTPQPYSNRPASAPNSPARNAFANFPTINRLPSQDSLDRSIHNESGHGKSTAQIVRDLKASNAQLSAKSAAMEAKFMNQLALATNELNVKHNEAARTLKQRNAHLEAYKLAADSKLKEKDANLSKTKEESAFQRHTISDLKNQLYQLQQELEEQDLDKRDDFDRLVLDNQEMARELQAMQGMARDDQTAKRELERQLEEWRKGETPSEDYYRLWQESQGELESHRKRLSTTESKMEDQQVTLAKEHSREVEELQDELQTQSEQWKRHERDLQSQIESLEFTDSQVTTQLRAQLEERDDTIAEFQSELDQYAESIAAMTHALEQVRKDASNQEQYRRDEAEDLRILHDAQEDEITKLRKDLDEMQREVELRDDELEEVERDFKDHHKMEMKELMKELEDSQRKFNDSQRTMTETLETSQRKLNDSQRNLMEALETTEESTTNEKSALSEDREDPGSIRELEEQLYDSREKATRLEQKVGDIQNEHKLVLDSLESMVDNLTQEKENISTQLSELQKEKDNAVTNLKEKDDEFTKLKNHWEEKSGAELEATKLRKEIENLKQRVQETAEAEKVANEKLQEYQEQLSELEDLRKAKASSDEEVGRIQKELEIAETMATQSSAEAVHRLQKELEVTKTVAAHKTAESLKKSHSEVLELQETIQKLESGDNTYELKKQLREAQIALVALDDEKKDMSQRHRELLSAVEKKKEEIQRETKEQLEAKDAELKQVQEKIARVEELEAEKDTLDQRAKSLESEVEQLKAAGPSRRVRLLEQEIEQLKQRRAVSPSEDALQDKEKFESTIQTLTAEKDALKVKLKDRDTAITALVRSSVSLEAKISSKEQEVREVTEYRRSVEIELSELRTAVGSYKDKEPKIKEDIITLQKELKMAKSDAKRWRRAMKEDGSTGSEYRFQISMLQKEVEDHANKVEERDRAIENLVNQSMSQDAHVKDLKYRISSLMKEVESVRLQKNRFEDGALKAEIRRLQQESEIFAGQIIEQDEELQNLKRDLQARDEQVLALKKEVPERGATAASMSRSQANDEEMSSLKKELSKLQTDLRARETQMAQLNKELEEAKTRRDSSSNSGNNDAKKLMNLQAELDELQEASDSNRIELRDLRKQLWKAKEAAGEANDLKLELAQAKYALEEFKRKGETTRAVDDEDLKKELAQTKNVFEEYKRTAQESIHKAKLEATKEDSSIASHTTELREQLNEALTSNKALEQKTAKQLENIRRSKNDAVDKLESKLKERESTIKELQNTTPTNLNEEQIVVFQKEIEGLRKELQTQTNSMNKVLQELKEREAALEKSEMLKLKLAEELADTKTANSKLEKEADEIMHTIPTNDEDDELAKTNKSLVKQNEELSKANKGMFNDITNLKAEVESSQKEQQSTEELKAELEQTKKARESTEKNIVESYEHQFSALTKDRDMTIDSLRKDLAASRGRGAEDITGMTISLNALQSENSGLREQFEVELQAKNQQIYALEHTLHAQEQIVENMRAEMDQLQSGMEHATEKRRGDLEDLQQEMMQIESRAMKQEREIIALKMQLEESKLEHKSEVVRLKDVIVTMEKESPLAKTVAELQNDDRMLEVRERLEQLKMQNTKLQEENLKLGGRLERAIIEIKSFETERNHSEEMDKENSLLRGQLKDLEKILGGTRKQKPRGAPASPARTVIDKENNVTSKDKSTKKGSKGSLRGLFKRRTHGSPSDEMIKEEKDEDGLVA